MPQPPVTPTLRNILLAGLPAFLVVALCLSLDISRAFTIDDPIFLRTAQQSLRTPTRPFAFDMCWEADGDVRRFSRFVAHAPLMGYVLIPAVISLSPEVTGHLLQILLLGWATLATASLAFRLGLSQRESLLAASLTAMSPVVIGMAATVMPDVLAMALSVAAIERFVAWRQHGGWGSAVAAVVLLALGPLARPHAAIMLPICALAAVPSASLEWLRTQWRQLAPTIGLLAAAWVTYYSVVLLTRDPAAAAKVLRQGLVNLSPAVVVPHAISLGAYLAMTTPFVLGVLVFLVPQLYWRLAAIVCVVLPLAVNLATGKSAWYLYTASALAYLAVCWILLDLWKSRGGMDLALALWIMAPFAVIPYLHMAAKYTVASAPAYAIVLALLAHRKSVQITWQWAALPAMGLILGMLIVSGDARAANMAREAVNRWLPSLEAQGKHVFFHGQWGFQWYAEMHHAACFDPKAPGVASPGEFVVVDVIGSNASLLDMYPKARLVDSFSATEPGGLVMNKDLKVGFYSDTFGRLPWIWAPAGTPRFELWEIQ